MNHPGRLALSLSCVAALLLAGCGGGGGDTGDADQNEPAAVAGSGFDESTLPDDFPIDLIPPHYDSGSYAELGPTRVASFESRRPVQEAIDHYTGKLGEPTLGGDAGEGQRTVQWQTTPWMVSVSGTESETIIGITKVPE